MTEHIENYLAVCPPDIWCYLTNGVIHLDGDLKKPFMPQLADAFSKLSLPINHIVTSKETLAAIEDELKQTTGSDTAWQTWLTVSPHYIWGAELMVGDTPVNTVYVVGDTVYKDSVVKLELK